MSNFNDIYKSILVEGRVPSIFRKATPEELAERKVKWGKVQMDEWVNNFLKREDIKKNKDGSWDVDGSVSFYQITAMTKFPVRFGKVGDKFWCDHSSIISLEGSPTTVNGDFWCQYTPITNLKGAPTRVGGTFACHNTKITSIEDAPETVGGCFWIQNVGRKFTEAEVRKYSIVRGNVYV